MYCVQQLYDAYLQIFFKWKSECHTPINGYDLLLKDIRHPVCIYKWAVQHDLWCLNILIEPHAAIKWSVQKHTNNVKRMSDLAGEKPCISPRMFGWRNYKIAVVLTWSLDFHKLVAAWMMILLAILMSSRCTQEQTNIYVPSFVQNKMEILFLHMLLPFRKLPCSSHTISFTPWNFHLNGTIILLVFIHLRILPGQVLSFSLGQWCLAICFLFMQPSCFVDIFFWGKLTQYQMNCNLGVSLLEWFL
jgi:hypothetical protein